MILGITISSVEQKTNENARKTGSKTNQFCRFRRCSGRRSGIFRRHLRQKASADRKEILTGCGFQRGTRSRDPGSRGAFLGILGRRNRATKESR